LTQRIDSLLKEFALAEKALAQPLAQQLALSRDAAAVLARTGKAMSIVRAQIAGIDRKLFQRDTAGLFSALAQADLTRKLGVGTLADDLRAEIEFMDEFDRSFGGINTSANVARMIKSAGQPWGGSWIKLSTPIDFSVNKIFKVKVYMPRVGAKLLLKVENASNPGISFEKEATGTFANAWEELTFDYSTINVGNQYQNLVFIFDLGTMGTGTADFTYLFDDIKLVQPSSVEAETEIPMDYSLSQNFPNPFNPTTNISFNLPTASNVSLKVYDMLGQEVAIVLNQFMNAGRFEVKFDASSLPTGIYTYSLSAGNFQSIKKMMLIK